MTEVIITYDSSSDEESETLSSWSKQEKFLLLQAIKLYHSSEIDLIAMTIPNKTKEDIQEALNYYKQKVTLKDCDDDKTRKRQSKILKHSTAPLGSWVKLLTDNLNYENLETDMSTALDLIAKFEKFPPREQCEGIDFSEVYHTLSNALQGKTLPEGGLAAAVIEKCILETALISKGFIRRHTFKLIIDSIDMKQKEMKIIPRPTPNNELAAIRHLASQRTYNPLNIEESHLKQSVFSE